MSINPDDVLALLEDGPKLTRVLAAWLRAPRQELRVVLRQMQAAGTLRRLDDNRVALASHRTPREREEDERQRPLTVSEERPLPMRPDIRTTVRTIDGVEYEVFGLDDLIRWKDEERALDPSVPGRGSSLSGSEMRLDVRR